MWFSKPIFSKAGEGYTQRSCSIVALGRSRRSFRGRIARRLRSLLSVVREKLLGNSSQEVCYHLTMVRAMLYGVTRYTQSYLYLFRRSAGGVAHGNAGLHEGAGSEGSLRKPRRAAQQRRGQHDAQDPLAGRRPSDGRRVDIGHDPQASDVGTGVTRPCVCITSALFSCQFFFFCWNVLTSVYTNTYVILVLDTIRRHVPSGWHGVFTYSALLWFWRCIAGRWCPGGGSCALTYIFGDFGLDRQLSWSRNALTYVFTVKYAFYAIRRRVVSGG